MHDDSAPLVVPDLHCPITPAVSPFAAQLDHTVAQWTGTHTFCRTPEQVSRYAGHRFGTFAARVCPEADLPRLTLCAQWMSYAFSYVDEFFGEDSGRQGRRAAADAAMATICAFVPGGIPAGLPRLETTTRTYRLDTLTDLLTRTARVASPDQFSRFGTQLTLRFNARLEEPYEPTEHIGFSTYLLLAEIVGGCRVTGPELVAAGVDHLVALATARTDWCDAIHSAVRHRSVDDLVERLPSLLRHSVRCRPQRALDQAARVHDERMRDYLRLERTVLATASPAVRSYVDLIRTWMRGHYDWWGDVLRQDPRSGDPMLDVRITISAEPGTQGESAAASVRSAGA